MPPGDAPARILPPLPDAPLCVAFSGGLDSMVLLHLLAGNPAVRQRGLRALHVHHGLQPDADTWVAHCRQVCAELDVALSVEHVSVPAGEGLGPEGAARQARRVAFAGVLADGEVLALAHHREDQAETFLLRALRASGPDGLAAMRDWQPFARGHLWRPLLAQSRASLLAYAQAHRLAWIEDPSNADEAFDRNFVRAQVMPLLAQRWPHAASALARSAALCGDAAELLEDEDAVALEQVGTGDPATLSRSRLLALPAARRARVLRRWIEGLRLPPLPATGVARLESEVLGARPDAEPRFGWHGAVVQAWRDVLHAEVEGRLLPAEWEAEWDGAVPLVLPTGDVFSLHPDDPGSCRSDVSREAVVSELPAASRLTSLLRERGRPTWRVHARRGGERITLPGRSHSHALKHVLQEAGIPPWERSRLPLLSDSDGTVLAAGDRIVSAGLEPWLRERGLCLGWRINTAGGD